MANRQFPSLNSQQADVVIEKTNEQLGPQLAGMIAASGLNSNHMIRFLYIASLCRNRREEMGLSLKEVSQRLKIPQYRLRAAEDSAIRQITRASLNAYVQFLGLVDQFAHWRHENGDVYDEIGADSK